MAEPRGPSHVRAHAAGLGRTGSCCMGWGGRAVCVVGTRACAALAWAQGRGDTCEDTSEDRGEDMGEDTGEDTSEDTSEDRGEDRGEDAGDDTGEDAGEDTGDDAGEDTGEDAVKDTAPVASGTVWDKQLSAGTDER